MPETKRLTLHKCPHCGTWFECRVMLWFDKECSILTCQYCDKCEEQAAFESNVNSAIAQRREERAFQKEPTELDFRIAPEVSAGVRWKTERPDAQPGKNECCFVCGKLIFESKVTSVCDDCLIDEKEISEENDEWERDDAAEAAADEAEGKR